MPANPATYTPQSVSWHGLHSLGLEIHDAIGSWLSDPSTASILTGIWLRFWATERTIEALLIPCLSTRRLRPGLSASFNVYISVHFPEYPSGTNGLPRSLRRKASLLTSWAAAVGSLAVATRMTSSAKRLRTIRKAPWETSLIPECFVSGGGTSANSSSKSTTQS